MRRVIAAGLILLAGGLNARGEGSIPAELMGDLKGATAFIQVEVGSMKGSGSGFVIKVEGESIYLVTNHHVVTPPKRMNPRGQAAKVTVVLRSGSKDEQAIPAEIVAKEAARDLAILKVKHAKNPPRPIALAEKSEPVETMPVFILGFPFGQSLSVGKANPAITINKGNVSSLRKDDRDRLIAVQVDGAINPGNSGGPVVDEQGRLVGVSVASIQGAGIGLAIAPRELSEMLDGRLVDPFRVTTKSIEKDGVHLEVATGRIDPLGRLKSGSIRLLRSDLLTSGKPKPNAKGEWTALAGARKVEADLDADDLKVSLTVPAGKAPEASYWLQASYVDAAGVTHYTEPQSYLINLKKAPSVAKGPPPAKIDSLIADSDEPGPSSPAASGAGGGNGTTTVIIVAPPSTNSRGSAADRARQRMEEMRARTRRGGRP